MTKLVFPTWSIEKITLDLGKKLRMKNLESIMEVRSKLSPEQSYEDIFSWIWSSKEACEIIKPLRCKHKTSKSDLVAHKYRMMGNIKLGKECDRVVLDYYNSSILSAYHPTSLEASCASDHETADWGRFGALSQAYDARSRLLYKHKMFDLCIIDIDQTLSLRCPQKTRDFLIKQKRECIKQQGSKKQTPPTKVTFDTVECPDPPTLSDPHPTIPALSSAVKLAYSPSLGRHLLANRDLHPGEVVGIEESFISMPLSSGGQLGRNCILCTKPTITPLPCHNCNMVVFCSPECQKEGMSGCHLQECSVLSFMLGMDDHLLLLVYRLMMKVGYSAMKTIIPELQSEAVNQAPGTLGFNSNGIYDGTHYRSLFHLKSHKDKIEFSCLLSNCVGAFVITKLLQQSGHYFLDDDGGAFTPSQDELVMTGSTVLHHLISLKFTNFASGEIWIKNNCKTPVKYAMTVCPTLNLFNYSCVPSCAHSCYGKVTAFRTVQFVPAGGALTVTNGLPYHSHNLQTRKTMQAVEHFYSCECEACEYNWPTWDTMACNPMMQEMKLKCVKCKQAINPANKKCATCHLVYDRRMPVAGSLYLTTYNYDDVMEMVNRAVERYHCIKVNPSQAKHNFSEEDEKVIINLVELLFKFVVQPHPLFQAQLKLLENIACKGIIRVNREQ